MANWDDVHRIAAALPGTRESTSFGNVAWRVAGKNFVWELPLRRGDLEALGANAPDGPIVGVHVEHVGMKEALLAEDPEVFFTIPHFKGYPVVLLRLERISEAALREVIEEAWLSRAPTKLANLLNSGNAGPGIRQL